MTMAREQTTYHAADGSHLTDDDAERIGRYLSTKFGEASIRPADFVSAARPRTSPLHSDLEWDDERAAHAHREEQARAIMRAIYVVVQTPSGKEQTRAFHSVIVNKPGSVHERAYVAQQRVWRTPEMRVQVVERAKAELRSWADRNRQYEELGGLIEVIDEKAV